MQLLKEHNFSVCILTKSDLVTRDIDLLKSLSHAFVGVSIAFQEDSDRKLFEGNTISNERRIQALVKLKEEDIETYALICPVMPHITNIDVLIDEVRPYADMIWVCPLNMKSQEHENWKKIRPILEQNFPEFNKNFKEIIFSTDHTYWKDIRQHLETLRIRNKINLESLI